MNTIKRHIATLIFLVLALGLTLPGQAQNKKLQNFRPYNQDGVNTFMPIQEDTTKFTGIKIYMGGAFTQQFQALSQSRASSPELPDLGTSFNLATGNLYMDAQLADGIRVNVTTYLSSRHHNNAWVKGGYLMVDELPMLKSKAIDGLMKYLTLRIGHMEINYGDAHFRRTDNANAIYNPFVGNYLMDSFTTEVGAELYYFNNGLLAMAGVSNSEVHPSVHNAKYKKPSFYGKIGYDKNFGEKKRIRLTASLYRTSKSAGNALYSGDRAGARYYGLFGGGFRVPRVLPGLSNEKTSLMINPFFKYGGLEIFGIIETASGNERGTKHYAPTPKVGPDKTWNQYAVDVVYRFLEDDQAYIAGRYNTVSGELANMDQILANVSVNRIQISAGWYMTKNILLKAEYMSQTYNDYPAGHRYEGAEVSGVMLEGSIAF